MGNHHHPTVSTPPLCSSKVVTGVPSFITHVVAGVGKTCHAANEPSNPRWFVGGWSVFGGCSAYFKPESPIQSSLSKKQTKISIQPSPVRRHRKGPSSHFRKSDLWMLQKLPTSISASENLWWMKEWCQKHRNVYFLRLRACNDASSIIVRPHGILQYGRCSWIGQNHSTCSPQLPSALPSKCVQSRLETFCYLVATCRLDSRPHNSCPLFHSLSTSVSVLDCTALHVLFIQFRDSVDQGGVVGMGAGSKIRPWTIKIKLRLLLYANTANSSHLSVLPKEAKSPSHF